MIVCFLKQSEKKWKSLHRLEGNIKQPAEKKFQQLKVLIKKELKIELQQEILQEIKVSKSPAPEEWNAIKTDLRTEILQEVTAAKSPEISSGDLQRVRDEVMCKVQSNNNELRNEV